MVENQEPGTTRPVRKRRFRLSLGVGMALVALLAVPMALVSNHARTQSHAISAIRHAGGFVDYNFRRSPEGLILKDSGKNPAPAWFSRAVPDYYYRSFNIVSLRGPKVSDATLEQIEGLEQLEELYLDDSLVTDEGLFRLRGLKNLKFLALANTQVTDAGLANLAGLSKLTYLQLSGTQITDAGLVHLAGLAGLRSLLLDGTRVGDAGLVQLSGMDQLIKLSLNGTQVGDAGLEGLRSHGRLISVRLSGTRVSPAGIAGLKSDMQNLEYIKFP
jgi:hypothetical protein